MSTENSPPANRRSLTGQPTSVIEQPISTRLDNISPWWFRGTAIVIIFLTLISLLNALIAEVFLGFASQSLQTIEPDIGSYPENGTESEQRQWNDTRDAILWMEATQGMIEDPRIEELLKVQRIGAILSFIVAAMSAFFLFNQDRKGLGFAALWVCITFCLQLYSSFISSSLSKEYFDGLYGNEVAWVQVAQSYGGYAQTAMCNLSLIGLLFIVWTRTKNNPAELISAFHHIPNNRNDFHP
jgi:hypothetical protein